jgi:DNA-binding SARP family transcriptional activator
MDRIEVLLLGSFEVRVDGEPVPSDAWSHARGRDLVKLLALAPRHRLARDQVIEELWPRLEREAALANLHKAAHHGRRALGHPDAVVLREGQVLLAPHATIETDVERFEATADPALYAGELLPDDRYATWSQTRRSALRAVYLDALRASGRWEALAAADPGDEPAQLAVMRERLASGDRAGALRAFDRLTTAMNELGLRPGIETLALHGRAAGGAALHQALAAVEQELTGASVGERAALLATRADLLMAIGDRGAPAAYREAAAAAGPNGLALRIRQAWAQLATGDPAAARATLAEIEPRSDGELAARLTAEAAAAWFCGDVEHAARAAEAAHPLALAAGLEREARTAAMVQAMVAHSLGKWPETLRLDLDASLRAPELAETLFDGHVCIAEYVLTSGEPHDRVRALVEELHGSAVRSGARRAQAFAATVLGELALTAGGTEEALGRLNEAIRLSRDIGANCSETLATVRLSETAFATRDVAKSHQLLKDALVMARWSPLSGHLLPIAHASALRQAADAETGIERLEDAEADLRGEQTCRACGMGLYVAGAIAAARGGEPDRAATLLTAAEARAGMWRDGPWPAALEEVRGEIANARGESTAARERLRAARDGFLNHARPCEVSRVEARLSALS